MIRDNEKTELVRNWEV